MVLATINWDLSGLSLWSMVTYLYFYIDIIIYTYIYILLTGTAPGTPLENLEKKSDGGNAFEATMCRNC